jgi:hypothetical protein
MNVAFIEQCGQWQGVSTPGQKLFVGCLGNLRPYQLVLIRDSEHQLVMCEVEVFGKGK